MQLKQELNQPESRSGMMIGTKIRSMLASKWFLPMVALAALLVRLALIAATYRYSNAVFADELDYLKIGIALEHGAGFVKDGVHLTAYRPPAQPVVIALLFRIFGESVVLIKLFEACLLTLIPFLCFRIGRMLNLSVEAANAGAALAALHPALAYASSTLYPTVLTAVALTLGVWLCGLAADSESLSSALGSGVAFGVAGSATTTFAPMALLAGAILLMRRRYRAAAIVCIVGTLPIVLWMARNQRAVGQFTVATNGGYNLYLGANDEATAMSGNWVDPHLFDESRMSELAVDEAYKKAAVAWIRQHPAHWGELVVERTIVVFDSIGNPRTQGLHSGLFAHLVGWLMLPVVVFGVVGLLVNLKRPLAWLTMAALLLVIASSAATIAKPRFRFPCDPLLAEFAIAGALAMKRMLPSASKSA